MQSDVRAVLQYVPSFRGKVFVVVVNQDEMTELAMAEAVLDLIALQQVNVRLVLVSVGRTAGGLDYLLTDRELKWQRVIDGEIPVEEVLDRGQLALVEAAGRDPLGEENVDLALSVEARKMIALIPRPGEVRSAISRDEALGWSGPDAGLFHRAGEICGRGIPRVHLLDQAHQGVLMDELFSNEGVGTMVYADDYLSIRPIGQEDISELLAMVGRSIRDAHLVPRSWDEIEEHLDDFLVLTIDGNVVGCVALHASPEVSCGEVACLYVKQSHGGRGYGHLLVEAAESRARELGLEWVFALSTRAAAYFKDSLGYDDCSIEIIPEERRRRLESSGRESVIVRKVLKGS